MEIDGPFSAIIFGLLVGGFGRLLVPGRQRISLLLTLVVGIVAALLGTAAATVLGVANTAGPDWVEMILQVVLAGVGVAAFSAARGRSAIRS